MDKQKKSNKIYENEISNGINYAKSKRRKYQLMNSLKNKNNEIPKNNSNNISNKNDLLYTNEKPKTSYVVSHYKNLIQNKKSPIDKYIIINTNHKLNSAKKRTIFPLIEKNEPTKPKKIKMIFNSVKIEENDRNNCFKLDTEMSVGDDKRKNDFNKYSTKYQYANNLNSLNKGLKNKNLEKEKNKKEKNEIQNNEQAKNNIKKNVIILKRTQINHNPQSQNQNLIYKKNIVSQEKNMKKININNESDNDKFSKEFDLFIESFKERKNEFIKKLNLCEEKNLNKNYYNDYLKIGNNLNKKGKFFLELFSPENANKYQIINEIKNFELKSQKVPKKIFEISKENNIDLLKKKNLNENLNEKKNFNITFEKVNNFVINKSNINVSPSNQEKPENIIEIKTELKNLDNNSINQNNESIDEKLILKGNKQTKTKEQKQKEEAKIIKKKFEIVQKIENCENKFDKKEERCITSFALLKHNRIVITFKGGIIKFYELEKKRNEIYFIELIRLEEEEYCFNYIIELQDDNIAACSEDGTVKIIQLFLDNEQSETPKEKYKIIQVMYEMNNDPIYIIKELSNQNLVLGCWKNILVYQKANQYELINKIKCGEYTFSILEISPNEILATHSDSKTLTGHNFNNYEFYTIKDIESNENNNIICKYDNKPDIVFVAFDKGINIVSIANKILIKKIILNEIISSICPIEMKADLGIGDRPVFGILLGAKRKIFGEKVNYAYSMLQVGFNLNEKDEGIINAEDNTDIKYEIISRKDRIHYYDITNLQNLIYDKNKNNFNIFDNNKEQWIFSSGNEDKLIKIWKFK